METIRYDLITALPELIVLSMAMVILLADLFIAPAKRMAIYAMAQFTLLLAAYFTFSSHVPSVSFAFSGAFVDDAMSDVLKLMMYFGTSFIFVYSRQYLQQRGMFRGEFYALVLFSLLGMMVMVSGQSLLTLYVGLELLSLSLYALVAMDRDNAKASQAIKALVEACKNGKNVMEYTVACARADVTEGEMRRAFIDAFGSWKPPLYR